MDTDEIPEKRWVMLKRAGVKSKWEDSQWTIGTRGVLHFPKHISLEGGKGNLQHSSSSELSGHSIWPLHRDARLMHVPSRQVNSSLVQFRPSFASESQVYKTFVADFGKLVP